MCVCVCVCAWKMAICSLFSSYWFLKRWYIIFFFFLGLHPQHTEVPRLRVKSELWLPTYTTAIATQDPSHIHHLCHSCGSARSLMHWARPGVTPASSWILVGFLTHRAPVGIPRNFFFFLKSQLNKIKWQHPLWVPSFPWNFLFSLTSMVWENDDFFLEDVVGTQGLADSIVYSLRPSTPDFSGHRCCQLSWSTEPVGSPLHPS